MTKRSHLVGWTPTVADLALYAYVARAPDGDISLEPEFTEASRMAPPALRILFLPK